MQIMRVDGIDQRAHHLHLFGLALFYRAAQARQDHQIGVVAQCADGKGFHQRAEIFLGDGPGDGEHQWLAAIAQKRRNERRRRCDILRARLPLIDARYHAVHLAFDICAISRHLPLALVPGRSDHRICRRHGLAFLIDA